MSLIVIAGCLLTILFDFVVRILRVASQTKNIPGPRGLPILGNSLDFFNISPNREYGERRRFLAFQYQ